MWGDAEGAYSLTSSGKLSKSLLAVTGPTHVPYHDSKWQQFLLNYEQLVHLHNLRLTDNSSNATEEEGDVVGKACRRCAKYCSTSSNLAALTLHVARMMGDLQNSIVEFTFAYREKSSHSGSCVDEINDREREGSETSINKQRIALIGRARASCGAVNMLRLFAHETIVEACQHESSRTDSSYYNEKYVSSDANDILKESFTYRSRDLNGLDAQIDGQDAAMDLISAVMSFLSHLGKLTKHDEESANEIPQIFEVLHIPEVYDVIVQILLLLLVLLSTQLYQPMVSSAQLAETGLTTTNHFFLEKIMDYACWQRQNSLQSNSDSVNSLLNGPEERLKIDNETLLFLHACFRWLISRPKPPKRSITSHYVELTQSIAKQLPNMTIAPDGMYESHSVVLSTPPTEEEFEQPSQPSTLVVSTQEVDPKKTASLTTIALGTDDDIGLSSPGHVSEIVPTQSSSKLLLPIRSILLLSSSLFLLPIRLLKLAFQVIAHSGHRALLASKNSMSNHHISTIDHATLQHIQSYCRKSSGWDMTNNVLWISDSPLADLSSVLILMLSNNCRASLETENAKQRSQDTQNPFRIEMATLHDERWQSEFAISPTRETSLLPSDCTVGSKLSVDFEFLFKSFGRITHTELGSLLLYTMMQSSPIFSASLMARSDLDTLVMPLLRTLYFSSKLPHETTRTQISPFFTLSEKERPFRSQSQLYVILILLLMFSQDPSFGRDSFRRVRVAKVKWHKERQIKDVSLGSMIILVIIKAITFNLNRLQDEFSLSNCIAILLNLSPHTVDLHPYVASRLISVTTSCFKRYSTLVKENNGKVEREGDMSSLIGMHGETCRTLLQLIKHSIRPKNVDKNLDLVYAILLEESTFEKICNYALLKHLDTTSIIALIRRAKLIIEHSGVSSAKDTMQVMKSSTEWKSYLESLPRTRTKSFDSLSSDASDNNIGSLTFQYEEESDPEIFFVPYIWDVTISTVTSSTFEWARNRIKIFPLNLEETSVDEITKVENSTSNEQYVDRRHTQDVV